MTRTSNSSRWYDNPPPSDGRKVIITDTDHYAPGKGDALWAWKSFLRGQHPILMGFGLIAGVNPPDPKAETPGVPSFASMEPVRYAMGATRRYAEQVRLIDMTPSTEVSSTGYALVNPGREYLVLQPNDSSGPFTVKLSAGNYSVEMVQRADARGRVTIKVERAGTQRVTPPFAGPAVPYLEEAAR